MWFYGKWSSSLNIFGSIKTKFKMKFGFILRRSTSLMKQSMQGTYLLNLKISKSSLLHRILGYFHETQTNFLMVPKTILNQLWQLRIICTRNTNWPTSKLLKSKKICDIIQQLSNTISCVLRGGCKCMKKTAINNSKLKNLDVQGL